MSPGITDASMGFLQSYRRLSRPQRVTLGLLGVAIGWYGPSFMNYLFLESRLAGENRNETVAHKGSKLGKED